jgi:hypothetical protein
MQCKIWTFLFFCFQFLPVWECETSGCYPLHFGLGAEEFLETWAQCTNAECAKIHLIHLRKHVWEQDTTGIEGFEEFLVLGSGYVLADQKILVRNPSRSQLKQPNLQPQQPHSYTMKIALGGQRWFAPGNRSRRVSTGAALQLLILVDFHFCTWLVSSYSNQRRRFILHEAEFLCCAAVSSFVEAPSEMCKLQVEIASHVLCLHGPNPHAHYWSTSWILHNHIRIECAPFVSLFMFGLWSRNIFFFCFPHFNTTKYLKDDNK